MRGNPRVRSHVIGRTTAMIHAQKNLGKRTPWMRHCRETDTSRGNQIVNASHHADHPCIVPLLRAVRPQPK